MYFLYIIECKDKTLYTGITTDVSRRFKEHSLGKGGNYTRSRGVRKLLYTEKHPDRSEASKREHEVKSLTRKEKLVLLRTGKSRFV